MSTKRLHAVVHGQVQGVSFRYYATHKANELGLVGWVHNRKDGTVEIVAEGDESALQQFETWLHEGSPHAKVEEIYITWDDATDIFKEFQTIFSKTIED